MSTRAKLITFDELREKTNINIVGATFEICYEPGRIERGIIENIVWYYHKHPRVIRWKEGFIWNPTSRAWIPSRHKESNYNFDFTAFEQFCGPYETEQGEIFLLSEGGYYAFVYPIGS